MGRGPGTPSPVQLGFAGHIPKCPFPIPYETLIG
jgi:hypothetical protein